MTPPITLHSASSSSLCAAAQSLDTVPQMPYYVQRTPFCAFFSSGELNRSPFIDRLRLANNVSERKATGSAKAHTVQTLRAAARTATPAGVSVVIPVYNSEEILPELVAGVGTTLSAAVEEYEIVLVNDGSLDSSWEMICRLATEHPFVRGLDLMRNYGQHNALLAGIRSAQYPVVVTMDDDLQHPPTEIPRLLEKLAEGYDVVYGTPQKEQHGIWRSMASQVTKIVLQGAMGAETARSISAFRAFRTEARQAFADYRGPFVSIDVLLTWATSRFATVAVRHDARRSGVSSYTFRKLLTHAINMMTGFSILPLRVASLVGFAFTLFGMLVLVYVLGSYLIRGGSIPGFPFLASVIAIFSGAQLFSLGVIGEYLSRMHFRTMGQPYCALRQTTGFASPDHEAQP
jgi:glycosyltransferase involved in cell wall biosynthesis